MEVLRVSTKSNPNAVAGALAGVVREKGAAEIQTIGAGALNQAVKAIEARLDRQFQIVQELNARVVIVEKEAAYQKGLHENITHNEK